MRSYSHLSEDERDQIGVLRAAGRPVNIDDIGHPRFSIGIQPIPL